MKPNGKLTIFALTFLALAASTIAQQPSPREQFQTAVAAYQKTANRPINEAEFDPNRRYNYECNSPTK